MLTFVFQKLQPSQMFFCFKILFFFSKFWLFFQKLRPSWMYLSPISVRWVCRWFWRTTRGDSRARHETLWLVHHGLLKKQDLNEARHERWGYMRGSKARRVFPSIFSLPPCLGFPQRECTPGIIFNEANSKIWAILEILEKF